MPNPSDENGQNGAASTLQESSRQSCSYQFEMSWLRGMDEAHAGRGEGRHSVIVVGREDVKYEALKAEVMLGFRESPGSWRCC